MVEIHKLATLAPAGSRRLGAILKLPLRLRLSGLLGPDRGSAVGMQQTAYACHKPRQVKWHRHELAADRAGLRAASQSALRFVGVAPSITGLRRPFLR